MKTETIKTLLLIAFITIAIYVHKDANATMYCVNEDNSMICNDNQ